jgi:excisionase family DNA binding protein
MEALDPGATGRSPASKNHLEPLAVSPRQACGLLGIGNTRLYELIAAGELVSYHEGRARRITMASIRARVARLVGVPATAASARRHRGRPRKNPATTVTP